MSSRKPKPAPAIVQQRTEEILRILLDGAESPWDTRAYVREKEAEPGSVWELPADAKPLSDSQIRRYVSKATAMIAESCRASRKRLLRRHLAQRRNLYAKAVSQGDIRAALACLDSEAKMTGLADFELAHQIEKLQREIEEIKKHGHGNAPQTTGSDASRSDSASPPGTPSDPAAESRPSADSLGRTDDAGPVAGEADASELDAGASAM